VYQQLPLAITPNLDSRFDNFYCSEKNRAVIAALKQFLKQDADTVFFLWGAEYSGVTHLLEAVQNSESDKSVQYLPLKQLKNFPAREILEGLDQLDFVIIDDIEHASSGQDWQEGLFHLHNRLQAAGKKLLIGGHCPPRELSLALADLKSRLQGGIVCALEGLSDAERQKAIQFCASSLGIEVSDELAFFLLQRIGRSARELFDTVRQLDKASLSAQRKLTIPFAKEVLKL
jgi:DnaA family protein